MRSSLLLAIPALLLLTSGCIAASVSSPNNDGGANSASNPSLTPSSHFVPRKTVQIIWSCAAAIISCTWVAIHPNIEFRGHLLRTERLLRRIYLVILTILTPELISAWALMQFRAAMATQKEFEELRQRKS